MGNQTKIYDLAPEEIDESIILKIIFDEVEKREFVITPLSVMGITGFPISEHKEILGNKQKIEKIKKILSDLSTKGILEKRKSKQDFRGIKEIGYNLVKFK
ncbi:hypothetical protein FEE95_00015 [Maribacter algarum]|uniref:Uncharacterized protein n=1 Tax=Maribacter algarum (ex Zhang et al. 2020) TaxID=2578118 RepID=A0A5S3QJ54_9FLAO|nr:hypothetical protein [Maribacter algarum]TMM57854.1 hypothetical protein FEE95_00015 [Maribacter algarum]